MQIGHVISFVSDEFGELSKRERDQPTASTPLLGAHGVLAANDRQVR